MRKRLAQGTGLTFAAPQGLIPLSEADIKTLDDPELTALARDSSIFLVGEVAGLEELVMLVLPTYYAELPPHQALRAELRSVGARSISVRDQDTPVGKARIASFVIDDGGTTFYGYSVFAELTRGVFDLTIETSAGPAAARRLLDQVLPTLRDVGSDAAGAA